MKIKDKKVKIKMKRPRWDASFVETPLKESHLVLAGLPFFGGSESFFEGIGECAELSGGCRIAVGFSRETSHFAFVHVDRLDGR